MKKSVFDVNVTYGTWNGLQNYATVPSKESADALCKCAKRLKYHDAHVVERQIEDYHAKNERQDGEESQGGGADEEGDDREGRPVRDLRRPRDFVRPRDRERG